MTPLARLEKRAEAMRARLRIRSWEHRQIHGSKGTWYRLRRMLARAREVHVVDDETLEALLAEGFTLEPVGSELEPVKRYVFLPEARARSLPASRSIDVGLSSHFLAAANVVLVPFRSPEPR